ncbi:MAG: hypothetical protein HYY01_06825 [Chloroflexi bacterium]|nr:hypothetical protein [Chloroflexota bacterium]
MEEPSISVDTQYSELYQHFRLEIGLIWRTLPVTAAIVGAAVVSGFGLVSDWVAREAILLIALGMTVALTLILGKFRYYSELFEHTLTEMETSRAVKVIQKRSNVRDDLPITRYWYPKVPQGWQQKVGADATLIWAMRFLVVVLLALTIYNAASRLGLPDS